MHQSSDDRKNFVTRRHPAINIDRVELFTGKDLWQISDDADFHLRGMRHPHVK
jgi:hypothetical protein